MSFQGEPGECSCPNRGDPVFSGMPVSGAKSLPPSLGERPSFPPWSNMQEPPRALRPSQLPPHAALRLVWTLSVTSPLLLRPLLPPRVLRDFGWAAPGSRARRCVSLVSSVSLVCQRPVACPPSYRCPQRWGRASRSDYFFSSSGSPRYSWTTRPPWNAWATGKGGKENESLGGSAVRACGPYWTLSVHLPAQHIHLSFLTPLCSRSPEWRRGPTDP